MKKVILGIVGVIVVLGLAIGVKIYVFPEPTNLELTFEGMEESGKASIKGNDIQYDGDDKEVLDFIASLKYEISPNKNLSNYDDVEVKVIFDEKARKEANVELESTSRTYQVRGLEETPEQKAERVEIIDGHEVPRDWELEDEDKKAYIEYLKQLENAEDELVEEKGAYTEWMKGNSKEETKKENKEFLTKDYANNSTVAFKRANEYGLTSSQEFKVQPIIKKIKRLAKNVYLRGLNKTPFLERRWKNEIICRTGKYT